MRPLRVVEPVAGPALYAALRAAVDGTGPAVLPSDDARTIGALRPDERVADEVCLVVPTSGSTGEPKGVELTASCLA
ncbi:MAG: O-succinylbenzoic acid--CoA ligase, partial [Frankiales bacterium]|nr:O-succinylbenzoic acid--CoA ligase [Frankiales bacterium]